MAKNESDFAAALEAFEKEQAASTQTQPQVGEKIRGRILSIGSDWAFIELGGKAEGQLAAEELRDPDGATLHEVGDEIEALVTAESADGGFVLRLQAGRGPVAEEELREAQRLGIPLEGQVAGINKGGAEVVVGGVRAFCPVSQLADRYVEDPAEFIGQRLRFRVTRFEEGGPGRQPNVVLSRRAVLEEEKRQRAAATRTKLAVGAVLDGEVTSIASYGAFVDLGGIEALLHVSEMSHGRVDDPQELLAVGQKLEVQVLSIEPPRSDKKGEGERISLSLRSLAKDPWAGIEQQYPAGVTLRGTVTRLESFGAFVELAPGIEGLVHVSELGAAERVRHPREVVTPGQEVEVRILDCDPVKRRLSLSIGCATAAKVAREEAAEKATFDRRNEERSAGFGSMAHSFAEALKKGGAKD